MAAKNSIKIYIENSIYHLYNRGVAKNDIFLDQQDYSVFCSYLKVYLLPKDTQQLMATISSNNTGYKEKDKAAKLLSLKNFAGEIDLVAYALLPNHYHLLIKQKSADGIDRFMNALGVRFSGYFNRKYHRVGPLFQGRYKAVLIETDEQLLHLSRYIHLNPIVRQDLLSTQWPQIDWPFSLPEYLGRRKASWVKPNLVLDYFHKDSPSNSYESFMGEPVDSNLLSRTAIDLDLE